VKKVDLTTTDFFDGAYDRAWPTDNAAFLDFITEIARRIAS
jgi:hypothetical protein